MIEQLSEPIVGNGFKWESMSPAMPVVSKFSAAEWHKIHTETSTDEEFSAWLLKYKSICTPLLLLRRGVPIAFVFVVYDNYKRRSVMIHGGTWLAGHSYSLTLFRAMAVLATHLMNKGFLVHSQCNSQNTVSERFLRGCGFVPYAREDGYIKFYITQTTIGKSRLYRHQIEHSRPSQPR